MRSRPSIEGEVSVFERVHVDQHGVTAPIGLKHARHRGRRGIRETA